MGLQTDVEMVNNNYSVMRTVSGPILQSVGKNKEDCIITCATLVVMCHMCYVFWGLKEKPLRVSLFQSMIHYL